MSTWRSSERGRELFLASIALASAAILLPACGPGEREAPPPEAFVTEEPAEIEESTPVSGEEIQEESLPPESADDGSASAAIEARSGSSLSGTAVFTKSDAGVHVEVKLSGVSPGEHGVHIHEVGDCSADDAKSAGGHFNPEKTQHGAPGSDAHHAGDFGNITIGPEGTGTLALTSADISLEEAPSAIIGRAIIIHGGADDLTSQPSGAAGPRIGCGVIR